ncbi:MAG: hypothetical protein KAQ91_08750 [Methylococcales bacterium]|nr:hypothetical protein [Methylococcales bacterium]
MDQNWIAIEGKAKISKNEIRFSPPKSSEISKERKEWPTTIVRSDAYFNSGEIECVVQINNEKDVFQLGLGCTQEGRVSIGLNHKNHAYGIALLDRSGVEYLSVSGNGIHPPVGEWIKLHIHYIGSNLELRINGITVAQANVNIHNSQIQAALIGYKDILIKDFVVRSLNPKAFVVMQFSDEYNALFNEVIKPICVEFNYDVIRADDMYTTGLIIEDITRAIKDSSLVIADITPNNANVYYEVGYAHGINKPTILLSDKNRDKLPFDISGFRLLFYDNSIAGKSTVETSLRKHLEAMKNA